MAGFFQIGCCETSLEDTGSYTFCTVITTEFLASSNKQRNDLFTPRPEFDLDG
jgi:hypothetical protein